jgi:hypothetical protein
MEGPARTSYKGVGWFGVALICKNSLILVTIPLCVLIKFTTRYLCCLLRCLLRAPRLGSSREVSLSSRRANSVGLATATIWLANFIIGTMVRQMLISLG